MAIFLAAVLGITTLTSSPPSGAQERCTGSSDPDPKVAKVNFGADCGRPFEETPDFRCDWTRSGYECSGPKGNSDDRSSKPLPGIKKKTLITRLQSDYNNRVLLEWTHVRGVAKYSLYRNGVYRATIEANGGNQRFHDPGVVNGRSYTYRIVAEFEDGGQSRTEDKITYSVPARAGNVDCKNTAGAESVICQAVLKQINDSLAVGRISYDTNGLLYTYDDPAHQLVDGGCASRTKITHKRVTARIPKGATLNVRGNSITEPFAIMTEVPFQLGARVDGETKYGTRVFFGDGCAEHSSDSYHADASFQGSAAMLTAFAFNPEFDVNADGDLELVITPRAHVAFDLRDPALNFRLHRVSLAAQFMSFITSLTTLVPSASIAGISGNSVPDALRSSGMDLGVSLGLGVLINPIGNIVTYLVNNYGEVAAEREAANIIIDVEADLNEQIAEALELDDAGQRRWVIDGDFAVMLENGATFEDVLVR